MRGAGVLGALALALAGCAAVADPPMTPTTRGTSAMHQATGSFTVTITPDAQEPVARLALAKTFTGGMAGTSVGTMLSAGDPASGSAGYVALEQFSGTLDGRSGGFALQHSGVMDGGAQTLAIVIVPGSGTGAFAGIGGTMELRIEDGRHDYTLRYALPE